jgi:hypothetical protein
VLSRMETVVFNQRPPAPAKGKIMKFFKGAIIGTVVSAIFWVIVIVAVIEAIEKTAGF